MQFKSFDKRGFTLAEMIVATSVLSLFVVLAFGAIVPAIKISKQAEESLAAQREVVLGFDKLVAEMGLLDRASVTDGPGVLSFLSNKNYNGTNAALPDTSLIDTGLQTPLHVWRKYVVLRHRAGQLWRREYNYNKGNAVFQIDPAALLVVADSPGSQEKIFGHNVEIFESEKIGPARVRLRIRSVFRKAAKPVACDIDLQIQMRGGQ